MIMHASSPSRRLAGWILAAFLALMASTASAAVLYEQLPLDGGLGYYAYPNLPQQMADDFTLGTAASLESVTWWGGYDGNLDAGDDTFLVRLYSSMTGTGTVLQEFSSVTFTRTTTGLLDVAGNEVYQYDVTLAAPISLSIGTYQLFVQNQGSSDWFWQEAGSGNSNVWFRGEDSDPWNALGNTDLAMRLEGTPAQAPEPSSFALLGIAGLSMLLARRRQRQAA